MTIISLIIALAVVAYLMAGAAITKRAMRFMSENALHDQDFFIMTIQDGQRMSLSTILPKLTLTILWPVALLIALAMIFAGSRAEAPA